MLSHTRKVLVNDNKGGNLMVLPLDQMLKAALHRQQRQQRCEQPAASATGLVWQRQREHNAFFERW